MVGIPEGLNGRGAEFWRSVESAYELAIRDEPVLLEVCRCLNEIDRMERVLAQDGPMAIGSTGQDIAHPLLPSLRAHRLVLDKLLVLLALPDVAGAVAPSLRQRSAKAAASVRWAGHVKGV